jgi:hypothetical protein
MSVRLFSRTFVAVCLAGGAFVAHAASAQVSALRASLATVNFATVDAGQSSETQDVRIDNLGGEKLRIDAMSLLDPNSGKVSTDFSQANDCGSVIAPGAACVVRIGASPSKRGTREAVLTVFTSARPQPLRLARIVGAGDEGALELIRSDSTSSAPYEEVIARNTSTRAVKITGIGLLGALSQNNDCGAAISPGAICRIRAMRTKAPSVPVRLTVFTASGATYSTTMRPGYGGAPEATVQLSETVLDFGTLASQESAVRMVQLTNVSASPAAVTGVSIGGIDAHTFQQSSTCGRLLPVGGRCTLLVSAQLTEALNASALLQIGLNEGTRLRLPLLARSAGAPERSHVSVFPGRLDFGSASPSQPASARVRFTNMTEPMAQIVSIKLSDPLDFTVEPDCGAPFALRAYCDITVQFIGRTGGPVRGAITALTADGQVIDIPVSGEGPSPRLSVTAWPTTVAGLSPSKAVRSFLVWNHGSQDTDFAQASVSPGFRAVSTCPPKIGAGGFCRVDVTQVAAITPGVVAELRIEGGAHVTSKQLTH